MSDWRPVARTAAVPFVASSRDARTPRAWLVGRVLNAGIAGRSSRRDPVGRSVDRCQRIDLARPMTAAIRGRAFSESRIISRVTYRLDSGLTPEATKVADASFIAQAGQSVEPNTPQAGPCGSRPASGLHATPDRVATNVGGNRRGLAIIAVTSLSLHRVHRRSVIANAPQGLLKEKRRSFRVEPFALLGH